MSIGGGNLGGGGRKNKTGVRPNTKGGGGGGGGGGEGDPHIHYWTALLLRRFHLALSSTSGRGTSLSPARECGGVL